MKLPIVSHVIRKKLRREVTLFFLRRRYKVRHVNPKGVRHMALFPELGLAYNRIKKNANTTTVMLLHELETGTVSPPQEVKDELPDYRDLSFRDLRHLHNFHTFVVIRNPYSRLLSAFLDKFRYPTNLERYGNFSLDPLGFSRFVVWLKDGGLNADGHWDLQKKLMLLPLNAYDSVVRFENYSEEMGNLLSRRGLVVQPDKLQRLYPQDRGKKTSASAKLTQYYSPEIQEIVQHLYEEDFAELGYSTNLPS